MKTTGTLWLYLAIAKGLFPSSISWRNGVWFWFSYGFAFGPEFRRWMGVWQHGLYVLGVEEGPHGRRNKSPHRLMLETCLGSHPLIYLNSQAPGL
jgi:hypothetical protein